MICLNINFVTVGVESFSGKLKMDYKAIVHEYAKNGWRLHTILILLEVGVVLIMELIFEKEQKEGEG